MNKQLPEEIIEELNENINNLNTILNEFPGAVSHLNHEDNVIIPKEIFESLMSSEEKYKTLFDSSPTYTIFMGLDGKIIDLNKNAEMIAGYPRDKLIGKHFSQLDFLLEEEKPKYGERISKLLKGEPTTPYESRIMGNDGDIHWIDTHLSLMKKENTILGILIIATDVTERKKAEDELKASKEKFRQITESIDEVFWIIDPKMSKIIYVSPAYEKIWGRSCQSLYKNPKSWIDAIHPEDRERSINMIWGESGDKIDDVTSGFEYRIVKPSGKIAWIWTRAFLIKDESGDVYRVTGVAADITGQKKAEKEIKMLLDELKRSNQELQRFAHAASHDMLEPLRTITSFTQILEKRYKGQLDSDADEFIDYIVDASFRMRQMLVDLLEYSKVGAKEIKFRPVDMESILKNTVANLNDLIKRNSAAITHDPLPVVAGEKNQILLVLQNLISNAIKFKKPDEPPEIHISAQEDNKRKEYIFSVRDNGIGIENQYFDRIFTIFQRLHTIEKYHGTGIGLSITKRIIEKHGGRIWVESAYGTGTTFYFTLPNLEK